MEQALEPGVTEPFFEFFSRSAAVAASNISPPFIKPKVAKDCEAARHFSFSRIQTLPLLIVEDIGYDAEMMSPSSSLLEYLVGEASSFHVIRHVENI